MIMEQANRGKKERAHERGACDQRKEKLRDWLLEKAEVHTHLKQVCVSCVGVCDMNEGKKEWELCLSLEKLEETLSHAAAAAAEAGAKNVRTSRRGEGGRERITP